MVKWKICKMWPFFKNPINRLIIWIIRRKGVWILYQSISKGHLRPLLIFNKIIHPPAKKKMVEEQCEEHSAQSKVLAWPLHPVICLWDLFVVKVFLSQTAAEEGSVRALKALGGKRWQEADYATPVPGLGQRSEYVLLLVHLLLLFTGNIRRFSHISHFPAGFVATSTFTFPQMCVWFPATPQQTENPS